MLLQNLDCEVNSTGRANVTPLHLAAGMDRVNVCKMLVSEVCYNDYSNGSRDHCFFEGGRNFPPKRIPAQQKLLEKIVQGEPRAKKIKQVLSKQPKGEKHFMSQNIAQPPNPLFPTKNTNGPPLI